ncbi:MAG: RHS repeat-associated core domain-containing protein [Anaerolineaceae bacterium]
MKTDVEGYQAGMERRTFCVGEGYEKQYTGVPDYEGEPPLPPVGNMDRLYLPLIWQNHSNGMELKYYFVAGKRVTVRINGELSWLYGDQLGSISAVVKADGTLISKSLYYPWGSERLTQGTSPTDYGYTGQKKEGDIYYYNARWYDPMIGRFMQADTIVPLQVQGIQAFDRYAYVNNNPVNGTDPSGHYKCNPDGRCFIEGWQDSYINHPDWTQGREENTCWAVSVSLATSIATLGEVTTDQFINLFPYRVFKPRRLGGPIEAGMGVPIRMLDSVGNKTTGLGAIYSVRKYSRETLKQLILNDVPVVIQLPLPNLRDAGHDVVVIGMEGDLFLFYSWGTIYTENDLLYAYKNSKKRDYGLNAKSLDVWMGLSNGLLIPNTMMAVYPRSILFSVRKGGGGSWLSQNRMDIR